LRECPAKIPLRAATAGTEELEIRAAEYGLSATAADQGHYSRKRIHPCDEGLRAVTEATVSKLLIFHLPASDEVVPERLHRCRSVGENLAFQNADGSSVRANIAAAAFDIRFPVVIIGKNSRPAAALAGGAPCKEIVACDCISVLFCISIRSASKQRLGNSPAEHSSMRECSVRFYPNQTKRFVFYREIW
jgi:hypothetical protein